MARSYLRKGDRGSLVYDLQMQLKDLGYEITVDGMFGNQTKAVVKAFQADHPPLKVDGYAGVNTKSMLLKSDGMKYQEYWYNNQTKIVKMSRRYTTGELIDVERMSVLKKWKSLKVKPTLLLNGGLYDTRSGKDLTKLIVNGKNVGSGYYSKMGLNFYEDGYMIICDPMADNFLGGSPTLLYDGSEVQHSHLDYGFIHYKHPRLGFGYDDDHYYVLIIKGRNPLKRWYGASLNDMINIFKTLGCSHAINLDGGGSISVIDKIGYWLNWSNRSVANMFALWLSRPKL